MSSSIHPMLDIGQQASREGRHDDAERAFRAVLSDEPDNFAALYNLGKLLWERDQREQGLRLFEAAADSAPEQPLAELALARTLSSLNRHALAERLCRRVLQREPGHADAAVLLGQVLARTGQQDEAARLWAGVLERAPGHRQAAAELAGLLSAMSMPGKARQVLESALHHHPEAPGLRLQYAAILVDSEDYDAALEWLTTIPPDSPAGPSALARRAEVMLLTGQPRAGFDLLREAGRDMPSSPALLLIEARLLNALGQPGEAANRLRQVLAIKPGDPDAWELMTRLSPEAISDRDLQWLQRFHASQQPRMQVRFGFALARVAHARGDLTREQALLDEANQHQRELTPYPADQLEAFNQVLRNGLDVHSLPAREERDETGLEPVFLLGMPFSGTELLESLLRDRFGWPALGETNLLRAVLRDLLRLSGRADMADLFRSPPEDLASLFAAGARQWLESRGGITGGPFIERHWTLHQYVPLLQAAFPEARFIQVCRDRRDLAVANYRHLFPKGYLYSHDLGDCLHMQEQFERMMSHWRQQDVPVSEVCLADLLAAPEETLGALDELFPGQSATAIEPEALARQLRPWREDEGLADRYPAWRSRLDG